MLVGRAAHDGLAVHAVDDHVVLLERFWRSALDGVENHVFGELVVLGAILLQRLDLSLKVGRLLVIANHGNHTAARGHAQLGKQIADELNVDVVDPIKHYRVHAVDDDVSLDHELA